QRGLADPRFTADDQRFALARTDSRQKPIELTAFGDSAHEPRAAGGDHRASGAPVPLGGPVSPPPFPSDRAVIPRFWLTDDLLGLVGLPSGSGRCHAEGAGRAR